MFSDVYLLSLILFRTNRATSERGQGQLFSKTLQCISLSNLSVFNISFIRGLANASVSFSIYVSHYPIFRMFVVKFLFGPIQLI